MSSTKISRRTLLVLNHQQEVRYNTKTQNPLESKQVRSGSRTYFIDIETPSEGKRYLKITESRFKGSDQERQRSSIIVFPEDAKELSDAISEMVKKL